MLLRNLGGREIVFFGGKGGVGKTTIASAAALLQARDGCKTLLVSTDPAHSTSDVLEAELGPEPRPVVADCWAMEIDPEREADRYIEGVKERVADAAPPRLLAEAQRQIDIARVSPGAVEAALFERFSRILEEEGRDYERIVFDTAPTGQTLRLLSLPELMATWIDGLIGRRKKVNALGKMWRNVAGSAQERAAGTPDPVLEALEERRARFHRTRQIITDSDRTGFVFVVVPERLPIRETEKAVTTLSRYGIPVAAVVVNQLLPAKAADPFLAQRKEREREHLASLATALGDWPLLAVPLLESDPVGVDALRSLGDRVRALPLDRASQARETP